MELNIKTMNTHEDQRTLDETGGDMLFADLFIETAQQTAAENGGYIPQSVINDFLTEVVKHRKTWEQRQQ